MILKESSDSVLLENPMVKKGKKLEFLILVPRRRMQGGELYAGSKKGDKSKCECEGPSEQIFLSEYIQTSFFDQEEEEESTPVNVSGNVTSTTPAVESGFEDRRGITDITETSQLELQEGCDPDNFTDFISTVVVPTLFPTTTGMGNGTRFLSHKIKNASPLSDNIHDLSPSFARPGRRGLVKVRASFPVY